LSDTVSVDPVTEDAPAPRQRDLAQLVAVNTSLLVAGRLAIAASGVVGVAAATRYLGRDGFAALSVALAFVSLFGTLTDVGLWTIAAREAAKHPEREREILGNAFTIGIGVSAAAAAVALAATYLLYGSAGDEQIRAAILIVGIQLLIAAPAGTAGAFMVTRQRAAPAAVGALLGSVVFVIALLSVIGLDLGFEAVAGCYLLVALVAASVPMIPAFRAIPPRIGLDPAVWRPLVRWAVPQGGVLILSMLYFRIDTVLLSLMSSDTEVALYGLAFRVLEILALFPAFFMVTLFPEIARSGPGSSRVATMVGTAQTSMAIVAVAIVVLFAGLAPEIVAVIGGPQFAGAVSVLRLLTVSVALVFVNTVFFHSLVALNRQRELLWLTVVVLGVNVGVNALLIPPLGADGAALALIVSELAVLVAARGLYARVAAVPRATGVPALLAAGVAMAAVVLGIRAIGPLEDVGPFAVLVVAAPAGLAVYAAVLHALGAVPQELVRVLAPLLERIPGPWRAA
jgi:O-antigen/teichoic acid export membrane protein